MNVLEGLQHAPRDFGLRRSLPSGGGLDASFFVLLFWLLKKYASDVTHASPLQVYLSACGSSSYHAFINRLLLLTTFTYGVHREVCFITKLVLVGVCNTELLSLPVILIPASWDIPDAFIFTTFIFDLVFPSEMIVEIISL